MSKNGNKVDKFIAQVRAGEIKDFTPYLTMKPVTIQVYMAKNGIMVDELVKQGNPVVLKALIESGQCQEHWDEWAKTARKDVRETLAYWGHCPDILIHDKEHDVRWRVFSKYPDYAKFCLNTKSTSELFFLVDLFVDEMNPNFEHVRQLRHNPLYAKFGIKSKNDIANFSDIQYQQMRIDLETKLEAFLEPASPMEHTMSLYQLFMSGSKRWPAMVNGKQRRVLLTYENELRTHKCGQEWFERIVSIANDHYRVCCDIEAAFGREYGMRKLINEID